MPINNMAYYQWRYEHFIYRANIVATQYGYPPPIHMIKTCLCKKKFYFKINIDIILQYQFTLM